MKPYKGKWTICKEGLMALSDDCWIEHNEEYIKVKKGFIIKKEE